MSEDAQGNHVQSKGLFISFEGPEGSGKSTQIKRLIEWLASQGYETLLTREPGGTPAGEKIRDLLQHDEAGEGMSAASETLLFEASRAELVDKVIRPALARGIVVISDRFADSTTAYQGYGRGFDPSRLIELHEFALEGTWPDLTILLDIDADAGLSRITERKGGPDRMERESLAFHTRVVAGYRRMAMQWPDRIVSIDASQSPDTVAQVVCDIVGPRLPSTDRMG